MTKIILNLPKGEPSPLDFYLDTIVNKDEIHSVIVAASAYERMKTDPYIKEDTFLPTSFDHPASVWKAEEATVNGRYYPPMEYVLEHVNSVNYFTRQVKRGEESYAFPNKKGTVDIVIIYDEEE